MESGDNKISRGAISLCGSEFKYSLKAGKVSFTREPEEIGNGTRSVSHVLRVKRWDSGANKFLAWSLWHKTASCNLNMVRGRESRRCGGLQKMVLW